MAEKLKNQVRKNWDLAIIGIAGTVLTVVALFTAFPNPIFGQAATTVTVYAHISEFITFTASTASTTLTPDLIDTSGTAHIASTSNVTFTLTTTSPDGYSITVKGTSGNGLATGTNYIYTAPASATLVAGTNGFGLQATTTSGMTIQPAFKWAAAGSVDVGSASSTAEHNLATKATPGVNQIMTVRFLAAASSSMPADWYKDDVVFTALATP
jgi:hypothetical protein